MYLFYKVFCLSSWANEKLTSEIKLLYSIILLTYLFRLKLRRLIRNYKIIKSNFLDIKLLGDLFIIFLIIDKFMYSQHKQTLDHKVLYLIFYRLLELISLFFFVALIVQILDFLLFSQSIKLCKRLMWQLLKH